MADAFLYTEEEEDSLAKILLSLIRSGYHFSMLKLGTPETLESLLSGHYVRGTENSDIRYCRDPALDFFLKYSEGPFFQIGDVLMVAARAQYEIVLADPQSALKAKESIAESDAYRFWMKRGDDESEWVQEATERIRKNLQLSEQEPVIKQKALLVPYPIAYLRKEQKMLFFAGKSLVEEDWRNLNFFHNGRITSFDSPPYGDGLVVPGFMTRYRAIVDACLR